MTPLIPSILFATILIQMVVAPSVEKIGGVLKTEVQKLLNTEKNVDKIVDIFQKAIASTEEAKKKVVEYTTETIPENLKILLECIADAPEDIYEEMKPMLAEMKQKTKKFDKKLQSESYAYRLIGRPVWGFFSGISYLGAGAVGYAMQALGTVGQLFNNGVKEGVIAYNDGGQPEGQTKKVIDTIENGVGTFKKWGQGLSDEASKRIAKRLNSRKGTMTNKDSEPEADGKDAKNKDLEPEAAKDAEGVSPAETTDHAR